MSEVKPCPFCGRIPIIGDYNGEQISCPNCHASIKISLIGCQYALYKNENENEYKGYEAVYQAIQIWNNRHEPEPRTLTLDELRERTNPVFVPIENYEGNGYWCLCQNGLITPPSCMPFMAKDRPNWVFYDKLPRGGNEHGMD